MCASDQRRSKTTKPVKKAAELMRLPIASGSAGTPHRSFANAPAHHEKWRHSIFHLAAQSWFFACRTAVRCGSF